MKLCRICSALLALILLACLFGVQGQYTLPNSGYLTTTPSANQNTTHYTQFYTMNAGPAPNTHISAPQRSEIADNMPTTIYFSNQMQPVPFSQYQSTPTYSGSTSLWIEAGKVVTQAEAAKAQVIGVRVCKDVDYKPVAEWLKKDKRDRAVLLHSAAYEPGIALFKQFPKQTTFGDLNPVIER